MTDKALHIALLEGFEHKSRKDGTVHTVHVDKRTVAEVCVGKKATRLNFRAKPKLAKGITLGGKSKSWPEGGVIVTAENLAAARAALASVTAGSSVTEGSRKARAAAARKVVAPRKAAAAA